MSKLAEYWNSTEVKRDLFKSLLHERGTKTYRVFNDGYLVKCFTAETDEDAIKIYKEMK